jgi:acyl-CoA-binding protein
MDVTKAIALAPRSDKEKAVLSEMFDDACTIMASTSAHLSADDKLKLYGLFKVGTLGPAPKSASALPFTVAASKLRAWRDASSLSQDAAQEEYVNVVARLVEGASASLGRGAGPAGADASAEGLEGAGFGSGYQSRPSVEAIATEEAAALSRDVHAVAAIGTGEALVALLGRTQLADGPAAGAPHPAVLERNEGGETPLHAAADSCNVATISLLLAAGADVHATEDGLSYTPLHYACLQGHVRAALLLLRADARLTAVGTDGATPWSLADAATRKGMRTEGFAVE